MEIALVLLGLALLGGYYASTRFSLRRRTRPPDPVPLAQDRPEGSDSDADALYRASSFLLDTSDFDRVLNQIVDAISEELGFTDCSILLTDEHAQELTRRVTRGAAADPAVSSRLRLDGPGLVVRAFRTANVVHAADVRTEPDYLPDLAQTRSELAIPLKVKDRVVGVLDVQSHQVDAFSDRSIQTLTSFAERAASTISQSLLQEELKLAVRESRTRLEQLQVERRRYEDLFSNINDIIYTHDLNGILQSINPAVARELGFQPEELLGQSIVEFIVAGSRQEGSEYLRKVLETGSVRGFMRVVDREGRNRIIEYDSSLIRDEGRPVGVRGIARDVTERLASEKRLRQQIEREALINRISRKIHQTFDVDEILSLSAEELGRHLKVDRCLFLRVDEETGAVAATHEFVREGIPAVAGLSDPTSVVQWLSGKSDPLLAVDRVHEDPGTVGSPFQQPGPMELESLLMAKVVDEDRLQAVLILGMVEKARDWHPNEAELIYAAASQVTIAVRQAKLYRQSQEASERSAVINRIATAIHQSLDLDEVLRRSADELGFYLDADRCLFYLWSADSEFAEVRGDYFAQASPPETPRVRWQDFAELREEFSSGHTVTIVEPIRDDRVRASWNAYQELGIQSVVYTPVIIDGRLAAVIHLSQARYARVWTEDEVLLVEEVARHLAIALRQAELFQQGERRIKHLQAINAVTAAISQTFHVGEILEQALRLLCDSLGVETGAIYLLDEHTGDLVLRHHQGLDRTQGPAIHHYRAGEGAVGLAAAERRLVVSEPIQKDPGRARPGAQNGDLKSCAHLPLMAKERAQGVLMVGYTGDHRFAQDELQLLGLMADQLSVAIEKAGLYESVSRSEEQYRSIFENASDGIQIQELETGRIMSANLRAAEIFGYALEEFLRLNVQDLCSTEEQREEGRQLTERLNRQRYLEMKGVRRTGKGGAEVIVEGTATLQEYQGRPAIMSIYRDVTERHRLEREAETRARRVAATNEMLEAISSTLGLDEMLRRIVQTLHEVFASDRSWLLFPADPSAEVLRVPYEVTHPDFPGAFARGGDIPAKIFRPVLDRVLDTHRAVVMRRNEADSEAIREVFDEFQFRSQLIIALRPRGSAAWVMGLHQCRLDRQWSEEEQSLFEELARYCTVALENVALYQRISDSEEKFRGIFENSAEGIFQSTPEGRYLVANASLARMLGYDSPDDLLALDIATDVWEHAPHRQKFAQELERNGQVTGWEVRLKRRDGSIIFTNVSGRVVRDSRGKALYYEGVVADFTEKKRAEEEIRQRNRELSALYAIALSVSRDPSPATVLKNSLQEIMRVLDIEFGGMYLRDGPVLRLRAHQGFSPDFVQKIRILDPAITPGLSQTAIRRERLDENTGQIDSRGKLAGLQSCMSVALLSKDDLVGAIFLASREYDCFSPPEVSLVTTIANQIVTAIENAALLEKEQQRLRELEGLHQISRTFGSFTNLADVYGQLVQQIAGLLDVEMCALLTYDPDRRVLVGQPPGFGLQPDMISLLEIPLDGNAAWYSHEPLLIHDPSSDPRAGPLATWAGGLVIRSILGRDVRSGEYLHGYALAMNKREGLEFTENDVRLLSTLVNQAAVVIENAKLYGWLKQSEQKYRDIFENAVMGIFQSSPEGRILTANAATIRMLGCSSLDELQQIDITRDLYVDHKQRERNIAVLDQRGVLQGAELTLRRRDGRLINVVEDSRAIADADGKVLYYEGTVVDITEKKMLEQQLLQAQKMESIGTLAGGIAHDFNNLLTGILGYTSLILSQSSSGDRHYENLLVIEQSARRAAELTAQLLAFSRRAISKMAALNLNGLVDETVKLLRRSISANVEIIIDPSEELWAVEADPAQLQQVLINLCINARDAMPSGGQLELSTSNALLDEDYCRKHLDLQTGRHVVLRVTDTGCGISSDELPKIFEPFYTTKETGKGTGLGLAMVYGIVQSHRGAVQVESQLGVGTTFTVILPATEKAVTEPVRVARRRILGRETVLVVDDEDVVSHLARTLLERAGYTVLVAGDGVEALQVFQQRGDDIDLVVLDLTMPKMGGRECYFELARVRPELKVLFSSGYSADGIAEDLLRSDHVGFVQKPYQIDEFSHLVREMLDRR